MRDIDKKLEEIKEKVKEYCTIKFSEKAFIPGETLIHYSGRIFDETEVLRALDSLLEFTLTHGKYAKQFEFEFSDFIGSKRSILTNSGSSANLLAVTSLCSQNFEKCLKPGDEVITPAATFPTTLNPLIQNNLTPSLIDIEIGTYNIDLKKLESALSDRTRLIMIPHTLGNPNDMDFIMNFAKENNLMVIEDNCDALGSKFGGKNTGTFGDIGTVSFYPAHHMTLGEGGAAFSNNLKLIKIIMSIRDWGRDCWCDPGKSNTCGKRFKWKLGKLPYGYDHKYIFSNIGYNLKVLDLQAAIGLEQLKKLPEFIKIRKRNFRIYYDELSKYEELILPRWHKRSDPSWFAFPITLSEKAKFKRNDIIEFLEGNKIETRQLFAGNITLQPAYKNVKFKIADELDNTTKVMNDAFFIGVYPGITEEMAYYVVKKIKEFIGK